MHRRSSRARMLENFAQEAERGFRGFLAAMERNLRRKTAPGDIALQSFRNCFAQIVRSHNHALLPLPQSIPEETDHQVKTARRAVAQRAKMPSANRGVVALDGGRLRKKHSVLAIRAHSTPAERELNHPPIRS